MSGQFATWWLPNKVFVYSFGGVKIRLDGVFKLTYSTTKAQMPKQQEDKLIAFFSVEHVKVGHQQHLMKHPQHFTAPAAITTKYFSVFV